MPPRTGRSTLFTYTTLFRSHPRVGEQPAGPDAPQRLAGVVAGELERLGDPGRGAHGFGTAMRIVPGRTRIFSFLRLPRDRKSTRLNSSHMSISYAVFCLKNT